MSSAKGGIGRRRMPLARATAVRSRRANGRRAAGRRGGGAPPPPRDTAPGGGGGGGGRGGGGGGRGGGRRPTPGMDIPARGTRGLKERDKPRMSGQRQRLAGRRRDAKRGWT